MRAASSAQFGPRNVSAASVAALPSPLQQFDRVWVRFGRRKLLYFGGCDYYRLASHPAILTALRDALPRFGLSVAASRRTTGNHRIYEKLEIELAAFFGAEAAVLVPSGYLTNLSVAQALDSEFSHAFIDRQAHRSLWDATRFLKCPVVPFRHLDPADLARAVAPYKNRPVIVLTDGVFSHNGAIAPLGLYSNLLSKQAVLLVDDAHGAGVLGHNGRGTPEHERVARTRLIQTLTLSKAFGTHGGVILASHSLRDRILAQSAIFSGATPTPLPLAAAARAALRLLSTDSRLRARLLRNIAFLRGQLRSAGFETTERPSPILAFQPRLESDEDRVVRCLLASGIYPSLIQYSSGQSGRYFRFGISSEHSPAQLQQLADVLREYRGQLVSLT